MISHVNVGQIGKRIGIVDRLPKVQARLRGVAINATDALKMIDKYDSKNTLFYIDPPYPETAKIGGNAPAFSKEDLAKLVGRLKHIRGKFILSMDIASAKAFPGWMNIQRVKTKARNGDGNWGTRHEVLATNYKITKPVRGKKLRRRARHRVTAKSVSAMRR